MIPRLILVALALAMGACRKPPVRAVEQPDDAWSLGPPVLCPEGRTCAVWKLGWAVTHNFGVADSIACVSPPYDAGEPGHLIAIDPNNAHIVVVVFDERCFNGWRGPTFTTKAKP